MTTSHLLLKKSTLYFSFYYKLCSMINQKNQIFKKSCDYTFRRSQLLRFFSVPSHRDLLSASAALKQTQASCQRLFVHRNLFSRCFCPGETNKDKLETFQQYFYFGNLCINCPKKVPIISF